MLLSNDASRNWISCLDEFGLQQQVTVPTHKSVGLLDQVITSEEIKVSEPLVNFILSSDHGVVHFDLLQKHKNLAIKKASCRNWQNFEVEAFERSRRKFEKAYRKNVNSGDKSRFIFSVLEYFELFTKKSEYLDKCVASGKKC